MISESFCKDFFWLNTITYTRTLPFCRSITTALAFVSRHRIPGHSTETFPAQLNFLRCPALHSYVVWQARQCLHFKLHTQQFTLYTPHFTLYTPHTLHFTLHNLHFTLDNLHFTPHILYTLHSTLYTLYSTYSTRYTP